MLEPTLLVALLALSSLSSADTLCYPAWKSGTINGEFYINGSFASYLGYNFVFQNYAWVAQDPCTSSTSNLCYPVAWAPQTPYYLGTQVSHQNNNFILSETEWQYMGACSTDSTSPPPPLASSLQPNSTAILATAPIQATAINPTAPSIPNASPVPLPTSPPQPESVPEPVTTAPAPAPRPQPETSTPSTTMPALWAGVNIYFLHTLPTATQHSVLAALQAAHIKTVRIFITSFWAGGKGTNSVGATDLEIDTVGSYNDAVLLQIDTLMSLVQAYDIKLMIALHDRWNLDSTWGICDAYCQKYASSGKDLSGFYNNAAAEDAFDARLAHIANHANALMGGKAWKDLSGAIYAFEIQNEGMGTSNGVNQLTNADWWCGRATALRKVMGAGSAVLVSTGGGQNFEQSLIPQNFACAAVDLVALHSYSSDIADVTANLKQAALLGKQNGKVVVFEEFGATSNKGSWISQVAKVSNSLGVPWMPWEVSSVTLSNDFEFWTDDTVTWAALASSAQAAY
ncbi:hypothetical protein HDU98_001261 [Podochytrium sp. JEL0797]|nr:hypothetical protein HDU98_001261 [Podochytrium sp. JEL0797]